MSIDIVPYYALPYFFSYEFYLKNHAFGDLSQHTQILRRGALDNKKGFFQFYFNKKTLEGVLSINKEWKEVKKARDLVLHRLNFENPTEITNEIKLLEEYSKEKI